MEQRENKPQAGGRLEAARPWLVNGLLLTGGASVVTAAFLAGPEAGFATLGLTNVALALLIHMSGGGKAC